MAAKLSLHLSDDGFVDHVAITLYDENNAVECVITQPSFYGTLADVLTWCAAKGVQLVEDHTS